MKKEIIILNIKKGFNENQNWIVYLPYDYTKIYTKTEKFVGLMLFDLETKYRIRVDKNIIDKIDEGDILQKAILEMEIKEGDLRPYYSCKRITIGNKVIEI